MTTTGLITDSESDTILRQLKKKAEVASTALLTGRGDHPVSLGFGSQDLYSPLVGKCNRWYKLSWGLDADCQSSFKHGLGEIVFWGGPQTLHSLATQLMHESLDRCLAWGTTTAGGSDRTLPNTVIKDPDLQWRQVAGPDTAMESVWGNETLKAFGSEADLHAESGRNFIGTMIRFSGAGGNTEAQGRLQQILQQHPAADLHDYVSIFFIAKKAHGQ